MGARDRRHEADLHQDPAGAPEVPQRDAPRPGPPGSMIAGYQSKCSSLKDVLLNLPILRQIMIVVLIRSSNFWEEIQAREIYSRAYLLYITTRNQTFLQIVKSYLMQFRYFFKNIESSCYIFFPRLHFQPKLIFIYI